MNQEFYFDYKILTKNSNLYIFISSNLINMGSMCCQQQYLEVQQAVSKSFSFTSQMFGQMKIQASSHPLTKHSIDLLIIFTDETFDLKSVKLINKLPQNEQRTIKELAKNLSYQIVSFSQQTNNLRLSYKQDQTKATKQWQLCLLDNPIIRIDIASFLFINTKVWIGGHGITKMLQQIFNKIKLKIQKTQTIGIVEVPFELGIPVKKFQDSVFQMIKDINTIQHKPTSNNLLFINQDSQSQTNEHIKDQQKVEDNSKDQEKRGTRIKKLIYLTNSKKSIDFFSENLKQFQGKPLEYSFLSQSDYY